MTNSTRTAQTATVAATDLVAGKTYTDAYGQTLTVVRVEDLGHGVAVYLEGKSASFYEFYARGQRFTEVVPTWSKLAGGTQRLGSGPVYAEAKKGYTSRYASWQNRPASWAVVEVVKVSYWQEARTLASGTAATLAEARKAAEAALSSL